MVNGKLRKEDRVSQDEVREWVKDIADWETSDRQTKLTTAIYNSTEKPGFLSFFSRAQAAKFLGNNGIRITPAAKDVKGNTVNRLISAMEVVHVHRDFIPLFMTDMERGIKTRVNFYVNTNNIEDEYAVVSLIQARIKEIEAWITTVGTLLDFCPTNTFDNSCIPRGINAFEWENSRDRESNILCAQAAAGEI